VTVPTTYREAVATFIATPEHGWAGLPFFAGTAQALAERLDARRRDGAIICPPPDQVFAALRATPLDQVRAVILGQDPYPTPGDAHGFAFSVPVSRPVPRSLRFIFDAYSSDLGLPRPASGDLSRWARRGVLLLNCIFTVESGSSNAHRHLGWEALAREVIALIDRTRHGVLFLLWGRNAEALGRTIDRSRHVVVVTAHPSPLARGRAPKGAPHPFVAARPFASANAALASRGLPGIDWDLSSE
jgi:uracil-DNA glycosylase